MVDEEVVRLALMRLRDEWLASVLEIADRIEEALMDEFGMDVKKAHALTRGALFEWINEWQ